MDILDEMGVSKLSAKFVEKVNTPWSVCETVFFFLPVIYNHTNLELPHNCKIIKKSKKLKLLWNISTNQNDEFYNYTL